MVTIKDVAKKAGVSISTASYALNNHPNVKPMTRAKVMRAATELNYYPNASARNLKTKRTKNIGVFVYGFSGPVFSDLLEGINKTVHQEGYNIVVTSGASSEILLKEKQVDAAIIFDSQLDEAVIRHYALTSPIVVLDRNIEGTNIYQSFIDNEHLVATLMRQVLDKGYRDVAYLSGPQAAFNNQQRLKGFTAALQERGLKPFAIFNGDFTTPSGYAVGKKIAAMKHRPDFLFCANDESALGVINAFKEMNLSIPKDMGLAGFDGVFLKNAFVVPKLTTIAIDHFQWGQIAALYLIRCLQQVEQKGIQSPVGTIVMNESC